MALTVIINESTSAFARTSLGTIELDNYQVLIQDVYVKVETVFSSKTKATAVVSYANDKNKLAQRSFEFQYDLNGFNPIKQAYLHLKTLPEFADAVDC
jgi:hypothetical protein